MGLMEQFARDLRSKGVKASYHKPTKEFFFGCHGTASSVRLRSPFVKMNLVLFEAVDGTVKMFITKKMSSSGTRDIPVINIYSEEQTKKAFDTFAAVAEKLSDLENMLEGGER